MVYAAKSGCPACLSAALPRYAVCGKAENIFGASAPCKLPPRHAEIHGNIYTIKLLASEYTALCAKSEGRQATGRRVINGK